LAFCEKAAALAITDSDEASSIERANLVMMDYP
jgi:hypothetical protein